MRYKIDVQGLQGLDDDLMRLAKLFPQAARKGLTEGARAARRQFLQMVFTELTLDKSKARQLVQPVRTTQKGAASFLIRSTPILPVHNRIRDGLLMTSRAGSGITRWKRPLANCSISQATSGSRNRLLGVSTTSGLRHGRFT